MVWHDRVQEADHADGDHEEKLGTESHVTNSFIDTWRLLQLVQGGLCIRIRPVETTFDMVLDQHAFGVADGGSKEAPDAGPLYGRPSDIETGRSQGYRLHLRRFGFELRCSEAVFSGLGKRRAELRMNTSSETTWIPAASKGLRNPNAASTMPRASTAMVPAKFCQMVPRVRRATRKRLDETHEIVAEQHHVGALARDIGAGAHGDADARLGQRRRVVDAVADHRDDTAFRATKIWTRAAFPRAELRLQFRGCRGSNPRPRDTFCISRQQDRPDTHAMQRFDRSLGLGPYGIGDHDHAEQMSVSRDENIGARRPIGAGDAGRRYLGPVIQPALPTRTVRRHQSRGDTPARRVVRRLAARRCSAQRRAP